MKKFILIQIKSKSSLLFFGYCSAPKRVTSLRTHIRTIAQCGLRLLCAADYAPGFLGPWTFRLLDFQAPEVKFIFPKKSFVFSRKSFFFQKKQLFLEKKILFFQEKVFFFQKNKFFSKNIFF